MTTSSFFKPHFHSKKQSNNQGFTLLELLIVIVILGVLVTIGLRSFVSSQMKARDTRRKNDIEQLIKALELYRSDKGHYPVHDEEGQIVVYWREGGSEESETFRWGEPFVDPANTQTIYMPTLPSLTGGFVIRYQSFVQDRDQASGFSEVTNETGAQAYRIYSYLENPQDAARVSSEIEVDASCSLSGDLDCNYVVSSMNLPGPEILEYGF